MKNTRECKDCGEKINPGRLKAIPQTKVCVDCQEENEKAGRFQLHRMEAKGTTRCNEIDQVKMIFHRGTAF